MAIAAGRFLVNQRPKCAHADCGINLRFQNPKHLIRLHIKQIPFVHRSKPVNLSGIVLFLSLISRLWFHGGRAHADFSDATGFSKCVMPG